MLITLDFETYWEKPGEYTLSKMSTSEYIRDDRFEAISCAIKIDSKRTRVYFGEDIREALADIEWTKVELLAHHTHFDGLILSHHYGHVPKWYRDTLSLGRALHPKSERQRLEDLAVKYGLANKLPMPEFNNKHYADLTKAEIKGIKAYNARDVDVCYELYQLMLKDFPEEELDLIDITCRMFCEPVLRVDLDLAAKELENEQLRKAEAIQASGVGLPILSSNPKFAKALAALGVDVPQKPSPSIANKQIPAIGKTDEAFQALLTHPDEKVVKLVEGRLAAKSTQQESKAQRMLLRGKNGWRFPLYLNYAGAHTYRWSGGDKLNPQNFKHGHKVGGGLKKAIMSPSPDEVIVVADASQIECRLLAWFFDQEDLLHDFAVMKKGDKEDPYTKFASKAYSRLVTKTDEQERFVGKTCILGLGYQMGGPKLQFSLLSKSIEQGMTPVRLPVEVCYQLVSAYREQYSNIKEGWDIIGQQGIGAMLTGNAWEYKGFIFQEDEVVLPNGLRLRYHGLNADLRHDKEGNEIILNASYDSSSKGRSKLYGGLFTENLIQALARIHVASCMRIIAQTRRVVAMEHDAIGFITKKELGQIDLDWCIKLMSTPPTWAPDVPLAAEGKFDERYPK